MSDIFINPTSPIQQLENVSKSLESGGAEKGKFKELLSQAVDEVNRLEQSSDQEVDQILGGEITDVHSAMIAMQKADLSFQMAMQVRNKLVEAYQEVMRMQV